MLTELSGLLADGTIEPLPHLAYDVREAPGAFRHMASGRHTGKIVLTVPRVLDPHGTVLVSGGTGELGRQVARHLVGRHGVRHLVLTSRQGSAAPGAAELAAELAEAGAASVRIVACDMVDRDQVAAAVAEAGREHPLTGVVHLAAVIDDGVVRNQTAERFERVLAPELTGAWHLHGRLSFDEPASGEAPPQDPVRAAQSALDRVSPDLLRQSGLLDRLLEFARPEGVPAPADAGEALQAAGELTAEEMDKALDAVLGDCDRAGPGAARRPGGPAARRRRSRSARARVQGSSRSWRGLRVASEME
ncbi:SDR family NAD(P)-dependent oxidoreductase [Streptomyces sp. NPDC097981]|uniref:SDR family NAD(P)-dependent oxidoreductase n=1 Tax=Streptomyces sp. NPDC097981 TaxID=3155428 RepID=UPI00332D5B89